MEIISTNWNIFFTTALTQSFIIIIVLFHRWMLDKGVAKIWLLLFILTFSYILLNNLVYWNRMQLDYPHFIATTASVRFLLAPFFFFCIRSLMDDRSGMRLSDVLHMIPFLIVFGITLPFLVKSGAEKMLLQQDLQAGGQQKSVDFTRWVNFSLGVQLLLYPLFIFKRLHRDLKGQRKRWWMVLNVLFLVYGICMLIYFILVKYQIGGLAKDFYISAIMCFAIYGIAYISLLSAGSMESILNATRKKYAKSPLDDQLASSIAKDLDRLMTEEKMYLDPELNLGKVARHLNLSRHIISQVLNSKRQKSFNQYINEYRVHHVAQLLDATSGSANLKTVMFSSGFNNRTSFNNNMKKIMGMTATEYLARHQHSEVRS